ncbi:MAG: hypothetical protein JJU28_09720 [Cyclobacteriaceae bacterium]|nr:hypothetical protein [Cyclobacteriaceae bacterium]
MDTRQKICRTFHFRLDFVTVFGLISVFSSNADCQSIASWDIQMVPVIAEVDPMGNLWLADAAGNLKRYQLRDGSFASFQSDRPARITSIDCSQTLRTLCFYKESQRYVLLNRFLTESPLYDLPISQAPFSHLCLSSDNHLWAFSQTDFALHKIRLQNPEIVFSVSLIPFFTDPNVEVQCIKEYKNRIYLCYDQKYIAVFDRLGKKTEDIIMPHEGWIGFSNDEIYAQKQEQLMFRNLLTGNEKTEILQHPEKMSFFLRYSKGNMIMIGQNKIKLYKNLP